MAEPRALALVRNAIAVLGSLDRHELVEPIGDRDWSRFFDNPCRALLQVSDATREVIWRSVQLRLPMHLREDGADQLRQQQLREFVRPDCPRCGAGVERVEPTNPMAGVKASVTYACGCVYADEDLEAVVLERTAKAEGASA